MMSDWAENSTEISVLVSRDMHMGNNITKNSRGLCMSLTQASITVNCPQQHQLSAFSSCEKS